MKTLVEKFVGNVPQFENNYTEITDDSSEYPRSLKF